jgi:hypothetical protein
MCHSVPSFHLTSPHLHSSFPLPLISPSSLTHFSDNLIIGGQKYAIQVGGTGRESVYG